MTTILLTKPQASALWHAATVDAKGGLKRRGQRWEVSFMSLWHRPSTIDALVAASLLRRIGTVCVRITAAGRDALEADANRSQGRALPAGARSLRQISDDVAVDTDEPVPEITHNADGSIEFTCAGCGQPVFQAIDDGFGFPACFECRWFDAHPQARKPEARA